MRARSGGGGGASLPDLFDVSRDFLAAVVDLKAILDLWRPSPCDRVEEPVRFLHVLTRDPPGGASAPLGFPLRPRSLVARVPRQGPCAEHLFRRQAPEWSAFRGSRAVAAGTAQVVGFDHDGKDSGRTCRAAHRLRRTWWEIRHRTSEADIFERRRRRHSSFRRIHRRPASDELQFEEAPLLTFSCRLVSARGGGQRSAE